MTARVGASNPHTFHTPLTVFVDASNIGWTSLFKTPGNRKRMLLIVAIAWFSQWSGNGLVSFYLNKVFDTIGITDATTQLLITGYANFIL